MGTAVHGLRVSSVHRLPFDEAAFERDLVEIAGEKNVEEWRDQVRENWENAWLVVVEWDGGEDAVDFDEFDHNPNGMDWSAEYPQLTGPDTAVGAWNELVLEASPSHSVAAFYVHFLNTSEPLFYNRAPLTLPSPTPASPGLWERVPYSSPD